MQLKCLAVLRLSVEKNVFVLLLWKVTSFSLYYCCLRRNLKTCQELTFASFANLIKAQSPLIKSSIISRVQITVLNDFQDLSSLNLGCLWEAVHTVHICPYWPHASFPLLRLLKSSNSPMFSSDLQAYSSKTFFSSLCSG